MGRSSADAVLWFLSRSPEGTRSAGSSLAGVLGEQGLVVGLSGPLGAGKTLFVKGLAEGMGIDPVRVASPSFVIASEYPAGGSRRLTHVDLYRIESEDELLTAGFLDLLTPERVVAVEWADRFPDALPPERLGVELRPVPDGSGVPASARAISAWASGRRPREVLAAWARALGAESARSPGGLEAPAWR